MDAARFRFLFREDAGEVDRATWTRYAGAMAGLVFALTLPWLWLRHHIVHDLAKDPLFAPAIFASYLYATFYGFALILIGVSYMNLTTKRFRAVGRPGPAALASLVPLIAFFTGALRLAPLISPTIADLAPTWAVWGMEAVFMGVAGWTTWELGAQTNSTR
jgi:uncharacterized membrane protein YhaH (DUF805 family)